MKPVRSVKMILSGRGATRVMNLRTDPSPTIMAGGIPNLNTTQHEIVLGGKSGRNSSGGKPEYRVPSMDEIRRIKPNGFNAISTFSGCGGSSLGYKMAGFRVLWANEFVPAAQDTYEANHVGTVLDRRDIRTITPKDILDATGLREGDLDLMDGSPPCASFSTCGSRSDHWGDVKKYSDVKQRTDDLFFEYIRLLKGVRPKTFVAENVSGLVKGVAKGYFIEILEAMRGCGYKVEAKLLDAQWLGVPQCRQRIIFVGVRDDLGLGPVHPSPLAYRYSVTDACPWMLDEQPGDEADGPQKLAEGCAIEREWRKLRPGKNSSKYLNLNKTHPSRPSPTITATGGNGSAASVCCHHQKRKFTIRELKRICSFPDDFEFTGSYQKQWERMGRAVPPVMMFHIASAVRDGVLKKIKP